jgi:hypothetical protein
VREGDELIAIATIPADAGGGEGGEAPAETLPEGESTAPEAEAPVEEERGGGE